MTPTSIKIGASINTVPDAGHCGGTLKVRARYVAK